jgi:hypothetical protein
MLFASMFAAEMPMVEVVSAAAASVDAHDPCALRGASRLTGVRLGVENVKESGRTARKAVERGRERRARVRVCVRAAAARGPLVRAEGALRAALERPACYPRHLLGVLEEEEEEERG